MNIRAKTISVIKRLEEVYPPIKTALNFETPFQLLIATILSAQTTDVQVNRVTPELFRKFPDSASMSKANIREIERIIRPTGFFRVKAERLKQVASIIDQKYEGRVPQSMDELLKLPGVGRKTANIVLSVAFGKIEGIAVDTHVKRVSGRIGLTRNKDPEKIEKDLMTITPRNLWPRISILLILHGRNVCYARKPLCERCVISDCCDYYARKSPAGKR
jgi:endonuclease-3